MMTDLERELAALLQQKADEAPRPMALDQVTAARVRRRRILTVAGGLSSAAAVVLVLALGARALIADPAPVPPATQVPEPTMMPSPSVSLPGDLPTGSPAPVPGRPEPTFWPVAIDGVPVPTANPEQTDPNGPWVDCRRPCVNRRVEMDGEAIVVGVWILTADAVHAYDNGWVSPPSELPLQPGSVPTALVETPNHVFVTAGEQLIRVAIDGLEPQEMTSFVPRSGRRLIDAGRETGVSWNGMLWISYRDADGSGGVMLTDAEGKIHEDIPLPEANLVAVAGSDVWVSAGAELHHIDANSLRIVGRVWTATAPVTELVVGRRTEIWTHLGDAVGQIDARTGSVLARYRVSGAIAYSAGHAYVANAEDQALYRIDPVERRVDDAMLIGEAVSLASGRSKVLYLAAPGPTSTIFEVHPGR